MWHRIRGMLSRVADKKAAQQTLNVLNQINQQLRLTKIRQQSFLILVRRNHRIAVKCEERDDDIIKEARYEIL